MISVRFRGSVPWLLVAVTTTLLAALTAPTTTLLGTDRRHSPRLREEDGEIVQNILWVAGFAAIAVVVVGIIRVFVINEATSLPTSGG
jgi:uncharacterized membrane protein